MPRAREDALRCNPCLAPAAFAAVPAGKDGQRLDNDVSLGGPTSRRVKVALDTLRVIVVDVREGVGAVGTERRVR